VVDKKLYRNRAEDLASRPRREDRP
jgi:hypothetical protein